MIIKHLAVGPLQANCFIIGCKNTKKAAVVDPGGEGDKILTALNDSQLNLEYILNTHGHFDHVGGNASLKNATGAKILIHKEDEPMLSMVSASASSWGMMAEDSPPPDKTIDEGDEITFGDVTLKVIHTQGHSRGGVSFYTEGFVFVGDTLFAGSIGRTDLPGGNYQDLIDSVKTKLFTLDDNVQVLPGHMQDTTIGVERSTNPFFR